MILGDVSSDCTPVFILVAGEEKRRASYLRNDLGLVVHCARGAWVRRVEHALVGRDARWRKLADRERCCNVSQLELEPKVRTERVIARVPNVDGVQHVAKALVAGAHDIARVYWHVEWCPIDCEFVVH
jgi:hypothetical protein